MTTDDLTALDLNRALHELEAPACVIDREGRFRWVNRRYLEIFGDRRGESFVDTVVPEHRHFARTTFLRAVSGKQERLFDVTVYDRNGDRVTLRVSTAPLRRADAVIGVFSIGVPLTQTSTRPHSPLDDLTPRQFEVLRLLGEGLETAEIARRLGVADETARNHIRGLLRTTGAHSRLEVVLMGLRHGVIAPDLTQPGHELDDPTADI
jgi:PAS domain S-box-containing protein